MDATALKKSKLTFSSCRHIEAINYALELGIQPPIFTTKNLRIWGMPFDCYDSNACFLYSVTVKDPMVIAYVMLVHLAKDYNTAGEETTELE